MEDALVHSQYPSILTSLPPIHASTLFGERVNKIHKINSEVARWLEERRKVEEQYAQGLYKLVRMGPPDSSSELGVFTGPWSKIVSSLETIAQSHRVFATRLESDVVTSLQNYATQNRDFSGLSTIKNNMEAMIKELDTTQRAVDKLVKKGGKANSAKVDQATQKLNTARQAWDSQAPFIFERLQAVDESRLNHLRDTLTQYLTHEADLVEKCRVSAEGPLNALLEVDTSTEIRNFVSNATRGVAKSEQSRIDQPRSMSIASSTMQATTTVQPPQTGGIVDDVSSLHSARNDGGNDSKVSKGLQRFGTMLKNRRQSMQNSPGFNRAPSPSKGYSAFSRTSGSQDQRPSSSPRASSTNLRDTGNTESRLRSLTERSPTEGTANIVTDLSNSEFIKNGDDRSRFVAVQSHHDNVTNGESNAASKPTEEGVPIGLDSSALQNSQSITDSEGFSVPIAHNDPISQAEYAVAGEFLEQAPTFKLNIKNEPIREEDADDQAALSNVSQALRSSTLTPPTRKAGTVRGRRDVRNTMYIPSLEISNDRLDSVPRVSPDVAMSNAAVSSNRIATLATLSDQDHTSDSGSIRSTRSTVAHASSSGFKHPEMHRPGLNSSIVETVSALLVNGEIKSCSVIGEIALAHEYSESDPISSSGTTTIRLDNFATLEAIAPNHAFVTPNTVQSGYYTVDVSQIAKTNVAFRYKVHLDPMNFSGHTPVVIKPAWRPQDNKLGVVLEYGLNPEFTDSSIRISNLVLLASYAGGPAQACQTKPTGTHVKDKSLIYWRIGDMILEPGVLHKVIARLTGMQGSQLQEGIVEARWELSELQGGEPRINISVLETNRRNEADPFADETALRQDDSEQWNSLRGFRKIISGKYEARQSLS